MKLKIDVQNVKIITVPNKHDNNEVCLLLLVIR